MRFHRPKRVGKRAAFPLPQTPATPAKRPGSWLPGEENHPQRFLKAGSGLYRRDSQRQREVQESVSACVEFAEKSGLTASRPRRSGCSAWATASRRAVPTAPVR
ncbi:hypothetical protein GCM10011335_03440 [Aureimonas glaciei]|uniref:Uncharacterized protein n=1 Tax=Aureimonas glaciei TaxID=1776957 RepID=A0A917D5T1_9HYPH|nr:hypothetical protein GCM10011335_03440 [Aureimonas glaciei]